MPDTSTATRWRSRIPAILACLLACYWLLMFAGTHVPEVPDEFSILNDKAMHFLGYFGLGVLFLAWRSARAPMGWKAILVTWLLIGTYGAIDELSQTPFGRDTDSRDWMMDLLGCATGLALSWPVAARIMKRDAM